MVHNLPQLDNEHPHGNLLYRLVFLDFCQWKNLLNAQSSSAHWCWVQAHTFCSCFTADLRSDCSVYCTGVCSQRKHRSHLYRATCHTQYTYNTGEICDRNVIKLFVLFYKSLTKVLWSFICKRPSTGCLLNPHAFCITILVEGIHKVFLCKEKHLSHTVCSSDCLHVNMFTPIHSLFICITEKPKWGRHYLIRTLATPSGHKTTLQSYCTHLNAVINHCR